MMTSLSGVRGIGKTYHLACDVYDYYRQGFFCITNFSHVYSHLDCSKLSTDEFYLLLREILLFKETGHEMYDLFPAFRHTGIFVAIDEGHLYFSADMWKRYQDDDGFQDIIKLLAQARKQDVNIHYTTQDPSKIDKNWRRYTEEWIRFTPVIPWRIKKFIPHETKPIFKREVRYPIPLIWKEWHNLDHANPQFNYATVTDEHGVKSFSPQSTLERRRIVRSGWMKSFPYKLFNSNQVLACRVQAEQEFSLITQNFSWVDHDYRKENYPTFKSILRMPRWDQELPKRYKFQDLYIRDTGTDNRHNSLGQPIEFIDLLSFHRTHKKLFNVVKRQRSLVSAMSEGANPQGRADGVAEHSAGLVNGKVTGE